MSREDAQDWALQQAMQEIDEENRRWQALAEEEREKELQQWLQQLRGEKE